jgi:hypothetical protein
MWEIFHLQAIPIYVSMEGIPEKQKNADKSMCVCVYVYNDMKKDIKRNIPVGCIAVYTI